MFYDLVRLGVGNSGIRLLEGGILKCKLVQMVPDSFISQTEFRRDALLHMAQLILRHCDVAELFEELGPQLLKVTSFDDASISLLDPSRNDVVLRYSLRAGGLPTEMKVEGCLSGWVWQNQQPLAVDDVLEETRFPECLELLKRSGMRSCCVLPLTTARKRLGALGLGSLRPNATKDIDLQLLQRVAEVAALAIENAQMHSALQLEQERLRTLRELSTTLSSGLELRELFPSITALIRGVMDQHFASLSIFDDATRTLQVYALDFPATEELKPGTVLPLKESASGRAFLERRTLLFDRQQLADLHQPCTDELLAQGIQAGCCIPLIGRTGPTGVLNLASREPHAFSPENVALLQQVAAQVAVALDSGRAYREISELRARMAAEKTLLQSEIHAGRNREDIIGDSPALERVLARARIAAPSDATVLILGETGTGKELVAHAIHRMSRRKDAAFIKLNCAAIPTGLLESELFGHEKGAFTGAVSQKIGRLELADRGTLFLDEVGDIPLELQPKLLRVLQDQEFERLGSTRTIKVNIRLIAATNRDLPASVADREFRSDLYYRLNVFPLRLPPLRERRSDIPSLAAYFMQKFAQGMNKQIATISVETMKALENWDWPGNVRELENFIERSVVMTGGSVLDAPLAELSDDLGSSVQGTLENSQREHIVRVLRETGGVIAGLDGAAARLGLKRTTLQSMIARLKISSKEYKL